MTSVNNIPGVNGASGATSNVQADTSSVKEKAYQIAYKLLEVPMYVLTFALGGGELQAATIPGDSGPTVEQLDKLYKFITDPSIKMFEGLTNREKYQYKGMTNRIANFGKGVNVNLFDTSIAGTSDTVPGIISNMVLRIESKTTGGAIKDFAKMFKDFQTAARNNGIYAMCYDCVDSKGRKNPTYDLIKPDSILGSQTTSAVLFVYELGELAVEFGLVDNFQQYLDLFHKAKPGKDAKSAGTPDPAFARIILLFKQFVKDNEVRILGNGVTLYKPETSQIIGPTKAGTGEIGAADAIIAVYRLYRQGMIVKPSLDNIALTKDPKYDKLMIKKVIKRADIATYGAQKAVAEAKLILSYCPYMDASGNSVTYKGDMSGGTWDDNFNAALKAATGSEVIDADTAIRLLQIAQARLDYVKSVINMKDNTNGKKLLEGVKGISAQQISTWNGKFDSAMSIDTKAGQVQAVETGIVSEYLAAMENDLQMITFALGDLTKGIDDLKVYLGNDSLVDVAEYQKVLDKLGPKGTKVLPRWDQIVAMMSLSKDGDINGVGTLISFMLKRFQESARNVEKSDTLRNGYNALGNSFETEVDRLRDVILGKIGALKMVKKAQEQQIAIVGMEDGFTIEDYRFREDIKARKITLMREARNLLGMFDDKKVENMNVGITTETNLGKFYRACDAVYKDELEERLIAYKKTLAPESQAAKDVDEKLKTIKDKREKMWSRAAQLFASKKVVLDASENRRKAVQANSLYVSLTFESCLEKEIMGRRVSHAGCALAQAYMEVYLGRQPEASQLEDGLMTTIPREILCGFVKDIIFEECK
jgi:hypothetical protein